MSDKEKIREVIEKRYEYWKEKEFNSHSIESEVRMSECQHLLLMVDSLSEEHSEDLDEEYDNYFKKHEMDIVLNPYTNCKYIARHFAEWQKQQMMKDALNCSIIMHPNDRLANYSISAYVPPLHPASTYISNGDKVKIIVIKED